MARKTISKKTRFEVFKRDKFKCQYCGSEAPSVVLVIDHIEPIALGGDNNVMNLVTSCVDCNSGKSARRISDSSVIDKQREQLSMIQEQRNQLEMMKLWRDECHKFEVEKAHMVENEFKIRGHVDPDKTFTDFGMQSVLKILRKHGLEFVLECMATLSVPEGMDPVAKLEKHINIIVDTRKDPVGAKWKYVYGILSKRFQLSAHRRVSYFKWAECAISWDIDPRDAERVAKTCRSWTEFIEYLSDAIDAVREDDQHESA
jgi:hypothetical protein